MRARVRRLRPRSIAVPAAARYTGPTPRTHRARMEDVPVEADWCDEPTAPDEPPAWAEVDYEPKDMP